MSEEKQVEKDRGEDYGNFELNMVALTDIIAAMVTQATQHPTTLPPNFGAMVMVQVKILRECHKSKPDNGLDAHNYLDVSRRIAKRYDNLS